MTVDEFKASLKSDLSPFNDPIRSALWYDGKEDWDKAHSMIDSLNGKDAAWVHAYLHRKEGDLGNAAYWYQRAGKPMAKVSLEVEWEILVREFLG
jgi:hypothetical protein